MPLLTIPALHPTAVIWHIYIIGTEVHLDTYLYVYSVSKCTKPKEFACNSAPHDSVLCPRFTSVCRLEEFEIKPLTFRQKVRAVSCSTSIAHCTPDSFVYIIYLNVYIVFYFQILHFFTELELWLTGSALHRSREMIRVGGKKACLSTDYSCVSSLLFSLTNLTSTLFFLDPISVLSCKVLISQIKIEAAQYLHDAVWCVGLLCAGRFTMG